MSARLLGAAAVMTALVGAHAARADAIDGAWCRNGGLRLMINGPAIITAAGTRTAGDYSRHAFSYVVPPSDPDPGTTISMRLINENLMELRANAQSPIETWLRCGPSVS